MLKIIGLVSALIIVLGMAGTGTWAYFNDTQVSTGNIFTAGTLDLGLGKVTGAGADGNKGDVAAAFVQDTWAPGGTKSGSLFINNAGSLPMSKVYLTFATGSTEGGVDGVADTANRPATIAHSAVVTITDDNAGDGTGAVIDALVYGDSVVGLVIRNGGSSYEGTPTAAITGSAGGADDATATLHQTGGIIDSVTLTDGGSGYSTNWTTLDNDKFEKMVTVTTANFGELSQNGDNGTTNLIGKTLAQLNTLGTIELIWTGPTSGLPATTEKELALVFTFNSAATNGCQASKMYLKATVTGIQ